MALTTNGTRSAPCGCRPATPSACRSTRSGRACAARTCKSRRCACGSPGCLSTSLEGSLEPRGAHLVLTLVDPLGGDLRLPGGRVLHVEALAAQGDAEGGLLLELEQAGLAVAPLVPGQAELLVLLELGLVPRPDGVLELLAGECEVHTVRVHLDELEVPPVEVKVQELVVELEHAELRELVDHDAHLEWAGDGDLVLAQLDLVGTTDLLEVLEPGRAEMLVNLSR